MNWLVLLLCPFEPESLLFGSSAWNIDRVLASTSWAMLFVRVASLVASVRRSIGGGGGMSAGGVGRFGSSVRFEALAVGGALGSSSV